MIINYKTKFNIGDEIYVSDMFEGDYCVDGPHKVKAIKLEIVKDGILVKYRCEDVYLDFIESLCFASREEWNEWYSKR